MSSLFSMFSEDQPAFAGLNSENKPSIADLSLDAIYVPVHSELSGVQSLYRETLLNSTENHLLKKLVEGNGVEYVPETFRVAVIEQISKHLLQAEGKWVRASLVVLAAQAGMHPGLPARQIAVAVELVHLATLIHDDIIDQAPARRGIETVSNGWGNSVAVLMGDLLFSKAFRLLLDSGSIPAQNYLTQATGQMCMGEIQELQHSFRSRISEKDYLEMISNKTASLMGAASASGGCVANLPQECIEAFFTYGHSLGMTFQITDDVLDYTASFETFGKQQGVDLQNEKITLPLIHLIDQRPEEAQAIIEQDIPVSDKALYLSDLMKETGSIEYAYETGRQYGEEARQALKVIEAECGASEALRSLHQLIDFVLVRER